MSGDITSPGPLQDPACQSATATLSRLHRQAATMVCSFQSVHVRVWPNQRQPLPLPSSRRAFAILPRRLDMPSCSSWPVESVSSPPSHLDRLACLRRATRLPQALLPKMHIALAPHVWLQLFMRAIPLCTPPVVAYRGQPTDAPTYGHCDGRAGPAFFFFPFFFFLVLCSSAAFSSVTLLSLSPFFHFTFAPASQLS